MQNRDFHKKQSVKQRFHWRLYQTFRNSVTTKICKNNAEFNINHRKNTWKLINPLMGSNNKSNLIKEINIGPTLVSDHDDTSRLSLNNANISEIT